MKTPQHAPQRALAVEQREPPGDQQNGVEHAESDHQAAAHVGAKNVKAGDGQHHAHQHQPAFVADDLQRAAQLHPAVNAEHESSERPQHQHAADKRQIVAQGVDRRKIAGEKLWQQTHTQPVGQRKSQRRQCQIVRQAS